MMRTRPPGSPVGASVYRTYLDLPPGTSPEQTQLHRDSRQDPVSLRLSAGLGQYAGCDAAVEGNASDA